MLSSSEGRGSSSSSTPEPSSSSVPTQQYTYWVDQSCYNIPQDKFRIAFSGARNAAARAAWRLSRDNDNYISKIFYILFHSSRRSRTQAGRAALRKVYSEGTFEIEPHVLKALPLMTSTQNRTAANYRYYCDNGPRNVAGGTRWTLRPDPPVAQRPQGYRTQIERPEWHPELDGSEGSYREWEDLSNGLCDGLLDSRFLSFRQLASNEDFYDVFQDYEDLHNVDALARMTAMAIVHEVSPTEPLFEHSSPDTVPVEV
ncbi:MAG: hypothetical protein Q9227_006253 [Pyrenula ochraceoflavens]